MDIATAAALYSLSALSIDMLPHIAENALIEGKDSLHLRILAGEKEHDTHVLIKYFIKSLEELNIPLPDTQRAAEIAVDYYAKSILSKRLSAYDGAKRIWMDIYNHINHPKGISAFVVLASEYEDYLPWANEGDEYYRNLLRNVNNQIIKEAETVIKRLTEVQ